MTPCPAAWAAGCVLSLTVRTRRHGDRFPGVILTHTAATRDGVDTLLTAAAALADGQVTAAADRPEQGDYAGHFTDPDGCHWTITMRA